MKCSLTGLLVFCLFIGFLTACGDQETKPSAAGKSGEILVVADSSVLYSEGGKIIIDSLIQAFPAIPQYEPLFRVVPIEPKAFKNILAHHRNVFFIETGPMQDGKNYSLSFKNDVYATGQLVVRFRAADMNWLTSSALLMSSSVIQKFRDEEFSRAVKGMKELRRTEISRKVEKAAGIELPLTDDYFIAVNKGNYNWIRKETIHMSYGIQIYRLPYVSDQSFSDSSMIALRDSLSKIYIPGPSKSSYMTTDKQVPAITEVTTINDHYTLKVKGLWRTEGDFMGGPYTSYLIHHKKGNELIFIDTFIYAPRFDKREYVKQMEAVIHSMRISGS